MQPIAKNALTILINISKDQDVLHDIANDDAFLESLLNRLTVCQSHHSPVYATLHYYHPTADRLNLQNAKEPNADEMAMLLANMAKADSIERLLTLERDTQLGLSKSKSAIDQLTDCFVKGATGTYNPNANYDYLAYLFADLAKVRTALIPPTYLRLTSTFPVPSRRNILHRTPPLRHHPPDLEAPPLHNPPVSHTSARRSHNSQEHRLRPSPTSNYPLSNHRSSSLPLTSPRLRRGQLHRFRNGSAPPGPTTPRRVA